MFDVEKSYGYWLGKIRFHHVILYGLLQSKGQHQSDISPPLKVTHRALQILRGFVAKGKRGGVQKRSSSSEK